MHTYPYVLKRLFFFFFFDVLVFRAQNDHQNATLCQTLSRVEDGFPLLVWKDEKGRLSKTRRHGIWSRTEQACFTATCFILI